MENFFSSKKLREFGLLVGILFPLIVGFFIPLLIGHSFRNWTLFIGLPLLILGIFKPQVLKYPYKFWIKIGDSLGFINSNIILGAIFLLILFPISLIMKISGYDPLRNKKSKSKTYRIIRKDAKINLEKIF